MKKYSLLVGNDINNIIPDNSWEELLKEIIKYCGVQNLVTISKTKPFPLLYEEIVLKALWNTDENEKTLKAFISEKVSKIKSNEIHERIRGLSTEDIMTTNYEFALEGQTPEKGDGVIEETLYSIFRHYNINSKRFWHIHGDCRVTNSINLGFEHYIGQLQRLRNYVVTGTNYESKRISRLPLIKRLENNEFSGQSWIELFFNTDIYILGLRLDFVETDLWWLLTYRARQLFCKTRSNIKNEIFYFIPKKYKDDAEDKIDFLKASGVSVIDTFSDADKLDYYNQVLNFIEKGY